MARIRPSAQNLVSQVAAVGTKKILATDYESRKILFLLASQTQVYLIRLGTMVFVVLTKRGDFGPPPVWPQKKPVAQDIRDRISPVDCPSRLSSPQQELPRLSTRAFEAPRAQKGGARAPREWYC